MENSQYICTNESKHIQKSKTHGKFSESTSPTQAAKALQAKVLGSERSDLLSATIFDDPERYERELRVSNLGKSDDGYATQLGVESFS